METNTVEQTGIIAWFARNPVAANLLMIGIMVIGVFSAITIRKEFFPSVELDSIRIGVPYLGAAPQEVEEGVCVKIEETIQDIEGIKRIRSYASEGYGTVIVEIDPDYDVGQKLDEIKNRVDAISTFPAETEKPVIYEQRIQQEVLWMTLSGDMDERSLKELGKIIREELVTLNPATLEEGRNAFEKLFMPYSKVTQADLRGDREYEISIEVEENTLREYGLTFQDIVTAVRNSSIDVPAGSIKTEGGEILLRTKGRAYTGQEFEQIVLLSREDGTRLLLRDIATVVDGFADYTALLDFNHKNALAIRVMRVGDQNALDISRTVRRYIEMREQTLPEGVNLNIWFDSSEPLKGRLSLMTRNALLGGLLVFLSLALFLRLKLAFWVMMGLPVCFLGTFWVMTLPFMDISINMITLFGFIVVLGIVVDDAIVIGENVYTVTRNEGQTVDNVIKGAKEVATAATFGVLTTVVAFMPMLMIPGVDGKIWSQIGIVIIVCLIFSLIESKLILPSHLAHMKIQYHREGKVGPISSVQRAVTHGMEWFVRVVYQPTLELGMKWRYVTLAVFVAMIIISVGLVTSAKVPWQFFPNVPLDDVNVNLVMAEGTPAKITHRTAFYLRDLAEDLNQTIKRETGDENGVIKDIMVLSFDENTARIIVSLVPSEDRTVDTFTFINRWRESVGKVAGINELTFEGGTGSGGDPINFQLVGNDFKQLDEVADKLKEKLGEYSGVFDIKDSFSTGKQEIKLEIKPEAEALGLSLSDLARQVRYAFYGAEAQRIQRGKDEVRVMVRYPVEDRRTLETLENMRIRTPAGDSVPFESVAVAVQGNGYSTISHVDRKRVVNVTADVDKNRIDANEIISDMKENYIPNLLRSYPGVKYELEGESREQGETMAALGKGLLLSILIIYALMAIPLGSYIKPVVIMSVIPFGIVGAILGHFIMGMPLSVLSLCGIIALSGVVVNDSLLMVDLITRKEKAGVPRRQAALESGPARFRAILLTSFTTFFGLLPMLWEPSLQAKFLKPMATSLAFGILFATFITLMLIPSLYMIIDDIVRMIKRTGAKVTGQA
jgi:multidrug efflux pump subunit AcrB